MVTNVLIYFINEFFVVIFEMILHQMTSSYLFDKMENESNFWYRFNFSEFGVIFCSRTLD